MELDSIMQYIAQYGLPLGLIAIAGVIVLGILKYCNVFKKLDEKIRHYFYLGISISLSLIGSVAYLGVKGSLTPELVVTLFGAIWALNQAFYSLYSNTPLKDLLGKLIEYVEKLLTKKKD